MARRLWCVCALLLAAPGAPVAAAPVLYKIDPAHTYPSFEADHMGISVWRGKFNRSAGSVRFDRATGEGEVEITVEIDSVDFGHELMNRVANSAQLFDVERYPTAVYAGRFAAIRDGTPTQVDGRLRWRDVELPLVLEIDRLRCVPHPLFKRELCGANATARFDRQRFGLDLGKSYGFDMNVELRIQVEAVAEE